MNLTSKKQIYQEKQITDVEQAEQFCMQDTSQIERSKLQDGCMLLSFRLTLAKALSSKVEETFQLQFQMGVSFAGLYTIRGSSHLVQMRI